MRASTFLRRAGLACAAALLLAACGDDGGTAPVETGPAVSIEVVEGDAQEGVVAENLPDDVVVKVTDAEGRAVAGADVQFVVRAGGGTTDPVNGATGNDGTARATWELGTSASAQQRLVVRLLDGSTGAVLDSAVATATPRAGAPRELDVIDRPEALTLVGHATGPFRVRLEDAHGNPIAGATITWRAITGALSLSASSSVTDAAGLASVVPTVGSTEGAYSLRAEAAGVPSQQATIEAYFSLLFGPLQGPLFGIDRMPNGWLVTSLIQGATVDIVDLDEGRFLPVTVGSTPTVVDVDDAGRYAYFAQQDGPLGIVDLTTGLKVADVAIPGGSHALALSPRGDMVYVTNPNANVYVVSVANRTVVDTIPIGSGPWGIAFRSVGTDSLMYVSSRNGGSVTEVDAKTGAILRTFAVGGRPHGLAMQPGSGLLWIADDQGAVKVLNVATGTITATLPIGPAFGIAMTPDGQRAFVTTNDGRIVVIDAQARTVVRTIAVTSQPRQVVVSADGKSAYAANMGGWIDWVAR